MGREFQVFLLMSESRPSNDCRERASTDGDPDSVQPELAPISMVSRGLPSVASCSDRRRGPCDAPRRGRRAAWVGHMTSSRGSMSSCSSLKALPWRPTCTALFFTTLLRFFSCLQHVRHFWCLRGHHRRGQLIRAGTRERRRRTHRSSRVMSTPTEGAAFSVSEISVQKCLMMSFREVQPVCI